MPAIAAAHPSSVLRQAADGRMEIIPWTVEQYLWAVNNHVLPEDTGTELVDGFIVRKDRSAAGEDPMTIGDRHRLTVTELAETTSDFKPFGCFMQTQQPVDMLLVNMPEPDGAVVRGRPRDYAGRPAGPADVLCVIEVSDASLLRDTTVKLRVYAAAGVPVYVVVDLQHDVVLVHRDPNPVDGTYPPPTRLGRGDTLALPAGGAVHVDIPVDQLL